MNARPDELLRTLLRFAVAIGCNIVLILLFPKLFLQSTISGDAQFKLITASISLMPLVILFPLLRATNFAYQLAAIALWLFPAFVFLGSVMDLFRSE